MILSISTTKPFIKGSPVLVKAGKDAWYAGTIKTVSKDGSLTVLYNDGDVVKYDPSHLKAIKLITSNKKTKKTAYTDLEMKTLTAKVASPKVASPKTESNVNKRSLPDPPKVPIEVQLTNCNKRSIALVILKDCTKKELIALCKHFDLFVKGGSLEDIKEALIDGVVGARIRSEVIQRPDTPNAHKYKVGETVKYKAGASIKQGTIRSLYWHNQRATFQGHPFYRMINKEKVDQVLILEVVKLANDYQQPGDMDTAEQKINRMIITYIDVLSSHFTEFEKFPESFDIKHMARDCQKYLFTGFTFIKVTTKPFGFSFSSRDGTTYEITFDGKSCNFKNLK